MKACYQLLQPACLAVPWGQKQPQHVLFNSSHRTPMVRLTDKFRAASHDNIKPWYSLLGMSVADVYDEFPESMWNIYGDSPETLRKKDQELNRSKWSSDTDFDSRFAESIVFDKTLYKYGILGCKNNADRIMSGGVISACDRDKIIHALERIEDDIELGKFEWMDGVDVHTNIVKELADKLGDLPKDLAVNSIYDSCLMILETWCKSYIDQIRTQTKQLQVALVLLALRNDGLVLPGNREVEDNTLLESLVLPILKALEHDASDLRCLLGLIYSSSDSVTFLRNSFPENDPFSKRFTIVDFARTINYCIRGHLIQLLEKFVPWKDLLSVTPHDEAATYDTILGKFSSDEHAGDRGKFALSKCLKIRSNGVGGLPQDCEIENAKYHLFSSVKVGLEMLNLSIKFVTNMSFNLEKVQTPLPRGYDDVIGFAHFLTNKGIALQTAYAVVHLCLEKQLQPSELTLDELRRIDFPCERAHGLLHDKTSVFGNFTCRDESKEMIKWCCKLRICPEIICP